MKATPTFNATRPDLAQGSGAAGPIPSSGGTRKGNTMEAHLGIFFLMRKQAQLGRIFGAFAIGLLLMTSAVRPAFSQSITGLLFDNGFPCSGDRVRGTVYLDINPNGTSLTIKSDSIFIVPEQNSISVPANQWSMDFYVNIADVTADAFSTVTVTSSDGSTENHMFWVKPLLQSFNMASQSVTAGDLANAQVSLNGPAHAAPKTDQLSISSDTPSLVPNQSVTLPTSLVQNIPITIRTNAATITASKTVNVSATLRGVTMRQMLTVNPRTNPVPQIGSLSPSVVTAGTAAFTLTLNGSGFIQTGSKVNFGALVLTPTFVSANKLTAPVPASAIAAASTAKVTVTNPTPGGGTSNGATFTILSPSVVTNTADSGLNSLRGAISYANQHPGTTITFNIPTSDPGFDARAGVFVIRPQSPLPFLSAAGTAVKGESQTAYTGNTNASGPEVVLDGAAAGARSGLVLTGNGCTVSALTLQNFRDDGLDIGNGSEVSGCTVSGCYIGTNAAGTADAGNHSAGVCFAPGAHDNNLTSNVISGNYSNGVVLYIASHNTLSANKIGTNAVGTAPVGNGRGVIVAAGSQANLIGGTAPGMGNLISGNTAEGLLIAGGRSDGNLLYGNRIGTDASGTRAVPNRIGLVITGDAWQTAVGTPGAGNLISGNSGDGVDVGQDGYGYAGLPQDTTVAGNTVGLNADGTAALPNGGAGLVVGPYATGTTIGGTATGAGNLVSGNASNGIVLWSVGVQGTRILANQVGIGANGQPLGNAGSGIVVASPNCVVGGDPSTGNLVAYNGANGIDVRNDWSVGVTVRGNRVFGNKLMALDLGDDGPTPNHVGQASGPNHWQNTPVLTQASASSGVTTLSGTLSSLPGRTYAIDLYSAGSGVYLGTTSVTTDTLGQAAFWFQTASTGSYAVTATDLTTGETSEYSPPR